MVKTHKEQDAISNKEIDISFFLSSLVCVVVWIKTVLPHLNIGFKNVEEVLSHS